MIALYVLALLFGMASAACLTKDDGGCVGAIFWWVAMALWLAGWVLG